METLGNLLQEERERKGLSVEKTANILKVRKKYLENIEDDNYGELPPDIYIKGFLKNYSRLLGLKEEKVVEIFEHQSKVRQKKSTGDKTDFLVREERKNKFKKTIITPEFFIFGALILVGFLLVLYFFWSAKNFSQPPFLEIENPKDNENVIQENIEVIGKVDEESRVEINNQEVRIDEAGNFKTQITLMDGLNEITIKAENKFGKISEKKLFINYEKEKASSVEKSIKTIILKVDSEPVWVNIKSETVDFSDTLDANSEKTVEIKEPTNITVEKGDGIYYIEGGGEMVIFGEKAEKVEKIFQP